MNERRSALRIIVEFEVMLVLALKLYSVPC